jgi:hypothetical protein
MNHQGMAGMHGLPFAGEAGSGQSGADEMMDLDEDLYAEDLYGKDDYDEMATSPVAAATAAAIDAATDAATDGTAAVDATGGGGGDATGGGGNITILQEQAALGLDSRHTGRTLNQTLVLLRASTSKKRKSKNRVVAPVAN